MLQTCAVWCCKYYFSMLQCVSMLQTRGVGCCVEEKGEEHLMLDAARNTGRNMAAI
jgi:hypothetical protein